jgi:hypothetical protein
MTVATEENIGYLCDYITFNIPAPFDDKQYVLEQLNPITRAKILLELLAKEREITEIDNKITQKYDLLNQELTDLGERPGNAPQGEFDRVKGELDQAWKDVEDAGQRVADTSPKGEVDPKVAAEADANARAAEARADAAKMEADAARGLFFAPTIMFLCSDSYARFSSSSNCCCNSISLIRVNAFDTWLTNLSIPAIVPFILSELVLAPDLVSVLFESRSIIFVIPRFAPILMSVFVIGANFR